MSSDLFWTGVSCPTGCGNRLLYNGNYYCENEEWCGWAVPEGWTDTKKGQEAFDSLMKRRAEKKGAES